MYMYTITHMDSYHFLGFPLALNSHVFFSSVSDIDSFDSCDSSTKRIECPKWIQNGTIVDDYRCL